MDAGGGASSSSGERKREADEHEEEAAPAGNSGESTGAAGPLGPAVSGDEPWQERKSPRILMAVRYKIGDQCWRSVTSSLEVARRLNGASFEDEEETKKAFSDGVKEMLTLEAKGLRAVGLVNKHAFEVGPEGEHEDDKTWLECWDEVSGKPVDPKLVKKARQEEIGFFRKKLSLIHI